MSWVALKRILNESPIGYYSELPMYCIMDGRRVDLKLVCKDRELYFKSEDTQNDMSDLASRFKGLVDRVDASLMSNGVLEQEEIPKVMFSIRRLYSQLTGVDYSIETLYIIADALRNFKGFNGFDKFRFLKEMHECIELYTKRDEIN